MFRPILSAIAVAAVLFAGVLPAGIVAAEAPMTPAQEKAMTEMFAAGQEAGDLFRAGRLKEAEILFRENLARQEAYFPEEPLTRASALHNIAAVLAQQGKADEALAPAVEALDLRAGNDGTPAVVASSQALLATILYDLGKVTEATDLMAKAVSAQIAGAVIDPRDMIGNASQLIGLFAEVGRMREAQTLRTDLFNLIPDFDATLQVDVYWGAARLAAVEGKLAEAETFYRRAFAALGESAPDDIRRRAILVHNIASILRQEYRPREAAALFIRAADDLTSLYPDGHPSIASALDGLGLALAEQGKAGEAWPMQRAALDMRMKFLPDGHPLMATSILNLGLTLLRDGQFEIARDALRTAMNRRIEAGDLVGAARAAISLAAAQHAVGDTPGGIGSLKEARLVFDERLPRGHPLGVTASINQAWMLLAEGEYADALAVARDAAVGLIAARELEQQEDRDITLPDEDKRRIVVNVAAAWEVAQGN